MKKIIPDTNVLVRIAVPDDDEEQTEIAIAEMTGATSVHLSPVVLAETEWVLRSHYRMPEKDRHDFFTYLSMSAKVSREQQARLLRVVELSQAGIDFADALIAAESTNVEHMFSTFDQNAAKKCQTEGIPVVLLKSEH